MVTGILCISADWQHKNANFTFHLSVICSTAFKIQIHFTNQDYASAVPEKGRFMDKYTPDNSAQSVTLPNLFQLAELAIHHGEVEGLTGQRHFSREIALYWDKVRSPESRSPLFHSYGFGGAGLTLAPAVAEEISRNVCPEVIKPSPIHKQNEILILGAGYIGIFAALMLRKDLDNRERQDIAIRVIASALPRGCSSVLPKTREPTLADNYSSQIAGGLVFPFHIGQLRDQALWPKLVRRSHTLWENYGQSPQLAKVFQKVDLFVLPDPEDAGATRACQIDAVNTLFSTPLFTRYSDPQFAGFDVKAGLTSFPFQGSFVYKNLTQVDTSSMLLHFMEEAIQKNIVIEALKAPITDYQELSHHFYRETKTYVINASGHGAEAVFDCQPSVPIRGDLLVLKLPLACLPENMRNIHRFCYISGFHYLFVRHELKRPWIHLVLGGSCVENDRDLSLHISTLREILGYWLDLLHIQPGSSIGEGYSEKKELCMNAVMEKITSP